MKHLIVIPNPFIALNADGLPCGYCFVDPQHARKLQIVGGTLGRTVLSHDDVTDGAERDRADVREARVKARSSIKLQAVNVQNTEYHRARIACGDLLAVDKVTAAASGIDAKDVLPPAQVMSDTLALRIAEWKAEHDGEEPACATLAFEQIGEGLEMRIVPTVGDLAPVDPSAPSQPRLFVPARKDIDVPKDVTSGPPKTASAPAGTEPAPKALGPKKTLSAPSVG